MKAHAPGQFGGPLSYFPNSDDGDKAGFSDHFPIVVKLKIR
jgi:hypothetical protein